MRIIDADRLRNKVIEWMPPDPCGIEERSFPYETDVAVSLIMEIDEAPTIRTKEVKYFDEDEKVWKIGEVIIDESVETRLE